jgi:predicted MPP superfamily phosphohydrolase
LGQGLNSNGYHSPDFVEAASVRGINLYPGGHTHGGQIRLPLYGAIATNSLPGKQYETGLFQKVNLPKDVNLREVSRVS